MRVLVADQFPDLHLEKLDEHGHDVRYQPELTSSTLREQIADADALVVRSLPVDRSSIAAAEELGLIVRAGAGVNTIDVEAASEYGIYVSNVPGKNAVAVAELTIGMLIALDRRVPDNVQSLRDGQWAKSEFSKASGLKGSTLGIIGMGSIGREVATRARAFGMRVVTVDRPRSDEVEDAMGEMGVHTCPGLPELLAQSDFVTLHLPALPDTDGMVDAKFLALMRDGACLVNTSRASLISTEDLIAELDAGGSELPWMSLKTNPALAQPNTTRDWVAIRVSTGHTTLEDRPNKPRQPSPSRS